MKIFLSFFLTFMSLMAISATSPQDAYKMAKEGKAVIVDVRELDEIKNGMIDKAVWLPMSEISQNEELMQDFKEVSKGMKIFLYCKSGKRAERCKDILLKNYGLESENLGGYDKLKEILPTKTLFQRVND